MCYHFVCYFLQYNIFNNIPMKRGVILNSLAGRITGFINIAIYETAEGKKFFALTADNEDVLPILYIVEDALDMY